LPKVVSKINKFNELKKDLTEWTGKPIANPYDMYLLYHLLIAESFLNYTLPAWAQSIFPYGQLFDAIKLEYELFSYTTDMRRLNGGKHLFNINK
jgi:prostatic aicd phosphatase